MKLVGVFGVALDEKTIQMLHYLNIPLEDSGFTLLPSSDGRQTGYVGILLGDIELDCLSMSVAEEGLRSDRDFLNLDYREDAPEKIRELFREWGISLSNALDPNNSEGTQIVTEYFEQMDIGLHLLPVA